MIPIFQDTSICCPKTLKIIENANPDLERFIIIFIIVYPPIYTGKTSNDLSGSILKPKKFVLLLLLVIKINN